MTLGATASATAGLYVGCMLYIDGGTGAGQSRYIVGYTAAKVAWVARSWTVTPDVTSTYVVAADNQVLFIHLGLAQAGAASTITLDAGASATDNIYNGQNIRITAGTGDNQLRVITAYNGTTKVATVAPAWTTQPDATSYFGTLQTGPTDVASVNRTAQTARDIGASVIVATNNDKTGYSLTAVTGLGDQTANITGNVVGNVTGTVAGVTPATAAQVAAVLTTQITESYRANAAAPTLAQFMSEVLAHLGEVAISGTIKTIKKLDHATTAETFTLDSATDPATITRAS